jgi:hypothetical protein
MNSKMLWVMLCFNFLVGGARAVPDTISVITADNISHLQPQVSINFADLPPEAGTVDNGRFYISADGGLMAVMNRRSQMIFLDDNARFVGITPPVLTEDGFPATFLDGVFDPQGKQFAAVYAGGTVSYLGLYQPDGMGQVITMASADPLVSVWFDADKLWLEAIPLDPALAPYLIRLPVGADWSQHEKLPHAAAQDAEAVVRIGRIPPPLAVTANAEGRVRRWNLGTGQLTAEARVDQTPIYGALTPDGRYLVWRDPASQALHVLDFADGVDRVVAALNGRYIPFMMLTMGADAIIGVHIDDEPVVMAWTVENGTVHPLGLYRQCSRPPDMVTLNQVGNTLVIGCDTGLEIWRVSDDDGSSSVF